MFVLRRLAAKHFTPRQDLLRTKKASFSSVDDALCTLSMCLCVYQDERYKFSSNPLTRLAPVHLSSNKLFFYQKVQS